MMDKEEKAKALREVTELVEQGLTPEEILIRLLVRLAIGKVVMHMLLIDHIKERYGIPGRIKWQG